MNRSRLDMNTASDSTPTMAFSWRAVGTAAGGPPAVSGAELMRRPPGQPQTSWSEIWTHHIALRRVRPEIRLRRYAEPMTAVPAEPRICSIARTLDIVGEKWALLALREG